MSEPDREVHIEVVKVQELDPSKVYLIELSWKSWNMDSAKYLARALKHEGATAVIGIRKSEEELKIVELPKGVRNV